jgi:hypothetical protein
MLRFEGSLARQLDFGDMTTTLRTAPVLKAELRLAVRPDPVRGPDKYQALAHRRHQAQITARRLLDLV